MNLKCRSIFAAMLILAAPLVTYAGSLECHGNIISPGVTVAQLLEACGNPTSRIPAGRSSLSVTGNKEPQQRCIRLLPAQLLS